MAVVALAGSGNAEDEQSYSRPSPILSSNGIELTSLA